MAKKKPKPESLFQGCWQIVSMTERDEDHLNEQVQAFIEIEPSRRGKFHFGYVRGIMDCRESTRDGNPSIEWTWDGNDEMDPAQGRGWATVEGDQLQGMIFFRQGDNSGFVAERADRKSGS